jgi:hypothetical protein
MLPLLSLRWEMKKSSIVLLLVTMLLSVQLLIAGPFGLEMGMSLDGLGKLGVNPTVLSSGGYYTVSPISPHREFEQYVVRLDPDEGVYWIKAIGKDIADSGYGFSTKSKFSEIEKALSASYGAGKLVDILFPNSIWDELDDWMMSIRQNERFYHKSWEKSNGATLAAGIASIYLAVKTTSSSKGYLTLEYYSTEYERLKQKAEDAESKVF